MPVVPVVAIEIPAEVAPDLASVALRTCNLALGSGRCLVVETLELAPSTSWLAHVGSDPSLPNAFRIELRDALPRETRTTYSRSLNFEDSDAPTHRWATVGVVVAALVISAETGQRPGTGSARNTSDGMRSDSLDGDSSSSVTTPTVTKSKRRPGPSSDDKSLLMTNQRALRFDFAGVAGPGILDHSGRYGLTLRPSLELSPSLGIWVQAAGSRAADSITVSWWSGAGGLAFVADIVPRAFAVEARLAIGGEMVQVKVTDETGASDSATRWRYGPGAGLDAVVVLANAFGLFVGIDGMLASPRVKIRQAGSEVGQSPTVETLVSAGLRWRIPIGR